MYAQITLFNKYPPIWKTITNIAQTMSFAVDITKIALAGANLAVNFGVILMTSNP